MKFIFEYKDENISVKAVSSKYDQRSFNAFIKLTPLKGQTIILPAFKNGEIYSCNTSAKILCFMVSSLDTDSVKPRKIFWVESPNGNLSAQTSLGNVYISNNELRIFYPDSIVKGSKDKLKSAVNDMHERLIKSILSYWI